MKSNQVLEPVRDWPKLATQPVPFKPLVTVIIMTITIAMVGALGQIVVHDIIPTFFAKKQGDTHAGHGRKTSAAPETEKTKNLKVERSDIFAATSVREKSFEAQPFYKTERFVWTLKWTHIHLFGMNMIFIFMGTVTLFLDLSSKLRTWLIILPFLGVLIDIAAVWLKGYISPAFLASYSGGQPFWICVRLCCSKGFWGDVATYFDLKKVRGFSYAPKKFQFGSFLPVSPSS